MAVATTAAQAATRTRKSTPRTATAPAATNRRRAGKRAEAPQKAVAAPGRAQEQAGAAVADRTGHRRPVEHAILAAERAVRDNSLQLQLPVIGEVQLPAGEEVAFIGGTAALALLGVLEWPVAMLLCVGHTMATARHNRLIRAFGEALQEA